MRATVGAAIVLPVVCATSGAVAPLLRYLRYRRELRNQPERFDTAAQIHAAICAIAYEDCAEGVC